MSSKTSNAILAVILGTMLAVSAVGSLISGFDLKIDQLPLIAMVAGLFALIGAIGFSVRYGSWAVLGILGMASIFFWNGGEAQIQTQALITRISYVYDQAYHWGVIRSPNAWYGVKADLPMLICAALIALIVTWTICKRRAAVLAIVAAFLPVIPCLVVTDTVPNTACVFLLLVGVLIVLITASARRRDPERTPKMTVITSVAVVAAVSLLFAMVPQKGYRNPFASLQDQILETLGYEGGESGGNGGDVDGVDLKGLGSRFFLQYPVMTVTAETDGVIYLREEDFNIYTGLAWESDDKRVDAVALMPFGADVQTQKLTVETRWTRRRLMVPYYVTGLLRLTDGGTDNTDKQDVYSWSVVTLDDNWKDTIPNEEWMQFKGIVINPDNYRSLPVETQGWAQGLLKTILTDNEKSATAKADAIAAYVREMVPYEDDCQRMPPSEKDFARWFVEEGESGYCVHFATSTAVLLRAAGVYTRYVTGYMVEAKAGEPTTVTADLEHAWVEYYEPALGHWVVLESTPAEIEVEEETETTVPTTTTTTPQTDNTTQPTQPTQPQEQGPSIPWRDIFAVIGKMALWVLAAATVIGIVIGQRRLREARRNRRYERSSQNERALMLWHEIGRMGRRLGMTATDELYALAQKAKFSQHTLSDEELRVFLDERNALIDKLRTRSALTRFVHRYLLRLY